MKTTVPRVAHSIHDRINHFQCFLINSFIPFVDRLNHLIELRFNEDVAIVSSIKKENSKVTKRFDFVNHENTIVVLLNIIPFL